MIMSPGESSRRRTFQGMLDNSAAKPEIETVLSPVASSALSAVTSATPCNLAAARWAAS